MIVKPEVFDGRKQKSEWTLCVGFGCDMKRMEWSCTSCLWNKQILQSGCFYLHGFPFPKGLKEKRRSCLFYQEWIPRVILFLLFYFLNRSLMQVLVFRQSDGCGKYGRKVKTELTLIIDQTSLLSYSIIMKDSVAEKNINERP